MVVALTAERDGLNRWQRWWNHTVVLDKPVQDAVVNIVYIGKKTNWDRLQQKIGRDSTHVVAGKEVSLPQTRLWKRFDSSRQKEEILTRTLISLRSSTDQIGLWDPLGRMQRTAWCLAQVYPRVTVWCQCREKYRAVAQQLMEEQGASLQITQGQELWQECLIMGAMEQPPDQISWKGLLLLAGPRRSMHQQGMLLHSLQVDVPPEISAICPKDIEEQELYLSLCQEQRTHRGKELCFYSGKYWDENRRIEDAVKQALTILT